MRQGGDIEHLINIKPPSIRKTYSRILYSELLKINQMANNIMIEKIYSNHLKSSFSSFLLAIFLESTRISNAETI